MGSGPGRAGRARQITWAGRAGSDISLSGPGGPLKFKARFGPGRAMKKWPISRSVTYRADKIFLRKIRLKNTLSFEYHDL